MGVAVDSCELQWLKVATVAFPGGLSSSASWVRVGAQKKTKTKLGFFSAAET